MPASRLQANWSAVSHGDDPISRVTRVTFSQGGSLASFAADGDRYPTVLVALMNRPRASVTCRRPRAPMAIAPGTAATFRHPQRRRGRRRRRHPLRPGQRRRRGRRGRRRTRPVRPRPP
ncbi:MAG: hypothetical protein U0790_23825 [Isosphaeraceae bacterium]